MSDFQILTLVFMVVFGMLGPVVALLVALNNNRK